ncbi:MAG: hypothetical protein M3Q93_06910 [Gemmatimonadota bacterium]|nr:hypothetical protein [Gemmatimonadota bacterium]
MLTVAQLRGTQQPRRSPYSDKQYYQEYILQRIEGYKNSIGRDELLRLGDEAASELQSAAEGQFLLTEVLMLESVDRLIVKRLSLRPYNRWRRQFLKLREAQRTPNHWGLEPTSPLARLLPRIEPRDVTLVIGSAAEPAAYLLAAHDAVVTFLAGDLGCVERVESRMATEALGSRFEGFVAQAGPCLPEFVDIPGPLDLVVMDPSALGELSAACRMDFIADLQRLSRPGSLHVILPSCPGLAPESLRSFYEGWTVEGDRRRRRRATGSSGPEGLVLCCPPCLQDTSARRSTAS